MSICPKCNNNFIPTKKHNYISKFCSRSCANSKDHSIETRLKQSKAAKLNPVGWAKNPKYYSSLADKSKEKQYNHTCQECNKTTVVNRSHLAKRKYCSIICSNKNKFHKNSTRKKRSIYNGYQMDSGAELYFAQILDKHDIKWFKNDSSKNIFFNYEYNGKTGKYYPDFFLEDYNCWVEIKGKKYIRDGDINRRMSVDTEVFLLISNNFKTELMPFITALLIL